MSIKKKPVIVITGPTASGKTNLAIQTASIVEKSLHQIPEIISADSRQIYKHIAIAASQPSPDALKKYKHHFIAELELNEEFNAGEYSKRTRNLIAKLQNENKIPIVCGGSGLYINALVYGLFSLGEFENKERQKEIRKKIYDRLRNEGIESLFDELKKVDPESASKMSIYNTRRIIRALEVFYLSGIPLSQFHKEKEEPEFEPLMFGLNWDRKKLYERINSRVEIMFEHGLIEEISKLKQKGYDYRKYNSLNTVGVKEVFDFLEGKTAYERMTELIKQNTRRFAKRQMTWFRKDKNIKWFGVSEESDLTKIAEKISNSRKLA